MARKVSKPSKRETSPRFTDKPRDVIARAPLDTMLPRFKLPAAIEIWPANLKVTYCPEGSAEGLHRTRKSGGLAGRITSCPVVANAYRRFV